MSVAENNAPLSPLTAVGFLGLTRCWRHRQRVAESFPATIQATLLQEVGDCDAGTRRGFASSLDGIWRSDATAADGCAGYTVPRPSFLPATAHPPRRRPTTTI